MRRSWSGWWLCAVLCAPTAAAQPAPDRSAASCPSTATDLPQLLTDSQQLLDAERALEASACFARAVERATALEDARAEAAARLGLATAAYNRSRYDEAEREGGAARALFEAQGDELAAARTLRLLGSTALMRNDRPEARRRYEQARGAFEALAADADRAVVLMHLARGLGYTPEQEIDLLNQSIDLSRRVGAAATEARALHGRADKQFAAGRFDAAVADLGAAIAAFETLGLESDLANAYVSLGRIYRAHGQPATSVEYYDRAGAIQERIGDLTGLVQSTNAKAVALAAAGRTEQSAQAYERALELARGSGSQRLVDFQQGNLAAVYAQAGDYRRAISLLEDVLPRESDPYILAYRHAGLARSYAAIGELARALGHADQAVAYAEQSENRDYLGGVLRLRATINRRMGRVDEGLADALAGISVIENVRARLVPLDFMKRGFADVNQELFGLTVALLHARGDEQEALVVAERARARAFLDLLASRDLVGSGAAAAAAGPGGAGLVPPRATSETTLASYGAAAPVSAEAIVATAARLQTTLLCYWVNDDELYIWVVSPGEPVHGARVPVARADLEAAVAAAVPKPSGADRAALRRLYGWLIEPVAAWLPPRHASVTVVPHGPLFRVSFAALRDATGAYLIERHALGYAPAVSVLEFTGRLRAGRTGDPTASALLVADPQPMPASPDGEALPRLPATAREVAAIRKALPASATALTGAAASEVAVRAALAGRRVVHFATHGLVLDDDPFDSFLALGVGGADAASDGRLTVREIYELALDADLVVLSACRTATGRLSGDGIVGMVRALVYAGAPAVVATLWDVADEPSAQLMARFYQHWTAGSGPRDALRQAQLDLLRELRSGRFVVSTPAGAIRLDEQPFYWAGYVFVGEP